jgi:hypothetical protein
MPLIGENLAEHFGKVSALCPEESNWVGESRPLSINVIYTSPDSMISALRSVESLARDLGATIHIRAMIAVPCQLALDLAFNSVQCLRRLITDLVERIGTMRCQYVLHIYVCRSRIETLLSVLRPSSLLVIGGRRRFWPTAESRICKAAISAGHNVAFVNAKAL